MRSSSTFIRSTISAGVALAVIGGASVAQASPDYPAELQSLLDMSCPPPCTICHLDNNGGPGTALKPFADAMIKAGLDSKDSSLLAPALAALEGGAGSGGTAGSAGGSGAAGTAGVGGSGGSGGSGGDDGGASDGGSTEGGATGGSGGAGGSTSSGGSGGSGTGDAVDSDGDGVGDVAELRQDRDPNVPGAGTVCGGLTYGCGARVEPRGRIDGVALFAAIAVGLVLLLLGRRGV